MYNILILMLATNALFFPEKAVGMKSTAMCWNQPSVSAGFYFWTRVGSALGKEGM